MLHFRSLVCPLFLAGCAGTGGGERATFVERDSAGVRIVESSEPALPPAKAWRLADTPSIDIGGGEDTASMLQYVQRAIRLHDGRLVVANAERRQILFYDSAGRRTASAGRQGRGPGEFVTLDLVGAFDDDSILLIDRDGGRFSIFTTDGKLVRTIPTFDLPGEGWDLYLTSDSRLALIRGTGKRSAADGAWRGEVAVWHATLDSSEVNRIGVFPGEEMFSKILSPRSRWDMSIPFGNRSVIAFHDTTAFVGTGDAYEIGSYNRSGRLVRLLRRSSTRRPVTKELLDWYVAEQVRSVPPRMLEQYRKDIMSIPPAASVPFYDRLLVDDPGNVWVREPPVLDSVQRWSVFDRAGAWLCDVVLPAGFTPFQIGDRFVLGTATDPSGVEHVLLYDLRKQP
jgi:hypothetical protein